MTGYVVAASAAIKWLAEEEFSCASDRLLKDEAMVVAPALVFAGDTNTLQAMRRRGDGTKTTGAGASVKRFPSSK